MLTKIVLGIDVILYGLGHLGKVDINDFYWGLVVLGVVYLLETLYAHRNIFERPAQAPSQPQA